MVGPVRSRGHLAVLPGGRTDIVDRRGARAARRYDRLTRRVFNARGEAVILPALPGPNGAA